MILMLKIQFIQLILYLLLITFLDQHLKMYHNSDNLRQKKGRSLIL
jgi:hypothetical protein